MWTDLRQEIEQARQTLHLPEHDFSPLPYDTNWRQLEEEIYHVFCVLQHPTSRPIRLWESFKPGAYGLHSEKNALDAMLALLDKEEQVWLMVNDSDDKFWFYQGKRAAIRAVLNECYWLDEVYLISKKREWLLCLTHHDVIYSLGNAMSEKLKARDASPVSYRNSE